MVQLAGVAALGVWLYLILGRGGFWRMPKSPAFHIVLVDDDSSDDTAETASRSAPPELLTVIQATPLPAGWTGKLWAVSQGVREAEQRASDYLLLTDADIVHPSGGPVQTGGSAP